MIQFFKNLRDMLRELNTPVIPVTLPPAHWRQPKPHVPIHERFIPAYPWESILDWQLGYRTGWPPEKTRTPVADIKPDKQWVRIANIYGLIYLYTFTNTEHDTYRHPGMTVMRFNVVHTGCSWATDELTAQRLLEQMGVVLEHRIDKPCLEN